jgi:hypothetical protein
VHAAESRYHALLDEIRDEFPGFRLIPKDRSLLQRSIGAALAVLTLGGARHYVDGFVTTIGQRVYVTPGWDRRPPEERYVTLRHERIHLRQFRRWGALPLALGYLLLPLPAGLAWVRMRLEREAYAETVRAAAEVHGYAHVCSAAFRAHVIAMFTSAAYAWMWPFPRPLGRWYDRLLAELSAGPPTEPSR